MIYIHIPFCHRKCTYCAFYSTPIASDRGSHSSPKLGEVAQRAGGVCQTPLVNTLYEVGALEGDPLIGDWYTSTALMEPLLTFNPANTGEEMFDRIQEVHELISSIAVDSAANPHAHYALQRIEATAQKSLLRLVVHDGQEDYRPLAQDYLQTLFDLKREYLLLWDQENGDYERYIVCNRYDDLAREVLELDRHVFI